MFERLRAFFAPPAQPASTAVVNYQSPENPATPLSWPAQWLVELMGGGRSKTGVTVSNESAMRSSAVFACVTLLSQTLAALPLKVLKKQADGSQMEAPDHPAYYLLHDEPNAVMTSVLFREYMMANVLLGGNGYAAIGKTRSGRTLDLLPLPYWSVESERVNGRMRYRVRLTGGDEEFVDQDSMIHVPGLGFDGLRGYSVISHAARESVGLAIATEEHGARMFENGATMQVVLSHPKNLSEGAQKRMEAKFDEHHKGLSNVARALVIEEGMTLTTVSMSMEDAQFLETRRFQVEDICRFFRVPPHMVGHTDKQTSWGTGVEQNTLGFLQFTLVPWLVRFEQEYNRKLFPRSPFYAQHKTQGLMRGDSKARAEYYSKLFATGGISPNEIRRAEDMRPIPGGDRYFVPANLIPLDQAGKAKPGESERKPEPGNEPEPEGDEGNEPEQEGQPDGVDERTPPWPTRKR